MIFTGNRHDEVFTFRKVDPDTWQDGEEIGGIKGGDIELSAFTDYKARLTMSFYGPEPPEHDSLVRVWYSFMDDDDEAYEAALGTFKVAYSEWDEEPVYEGGELAGVAYSGKANAAGVLRMADQDGPTMPWTEPAGALAVQRAAEIISACGLRVTVADQSTYALRSAHTFDAGASWLAIADWLLAAAGFRSAQPDPMGRIVLQRPHGAAEPLWGFAPGEASIMEGPMGVSNEWQEGFNTCRLFYSDEAGAVWAVARNESGSRMSVDARGVQSLREEVTQLDGATADERLAAIKAMALARVEDGAVELEHFKVSHPYVPLRPYDSIAAGAGGERRAGEATNITIKLEPDAMCETSARRFIAADIRTSVTGGKA